MTSDAIARKLAALEGWSLEGRTITRQFVFDSFPDAVAFVVRIGFDAEAADHHPDILISDYKKVTITFTTHSAGGLTAMDVTGAEGVNRLFGSKRQP